MIQLRLRKALLLISSVFLLVALDVGQQKKPLTNDDVINMLKNGLQESTVITAIQHSPSAFDVSPDGLIALKKAGVNQNILNAMIASGGTPASAAQTQTAATSGQSQSTVAHPVVALIESGSPRELNLEKAQVVHTKTKAATLSALASDSALNQALQAGMNTAVMEAQVHTRSLAGNSAIGSAGGIFGGMMSRRKSTVTYVWAVPGATSSTVVATNPPTFSVRLSGVPGLAPEDYRPELVKLTPSSNNWRLVGATQAKSDVFSSSSPEWQVYSAFIEDPVPAQVKKTGAGEFQITNASPLAPGEYAIVIRPISKAKTFSGAELSSGQGSGMIVDSAWTFAVK